MVEENTDPEALLCEFEQACKIDLRLSPLTIKEHIRHVRRLCDFLGKPPGEATRQELRQFLAANPAVNAIKAIRVFYGGFLGSDLASCFKVPQSPPCFKSMPTREQLKNVFDGLDTLELKAAFLLLVTSGIRRHELMELTPAKIDLEKRMIMPPPESNPTKRQWITFFNRETKAVLEKLLRAKNPGLNERILTFHKDSLTRKFRQISAKIGIQITPKVLREWFCSEMGRLGVSDRYVDAFCGRIPRSVLARHYTDFGPERLKEIYDKADLRVFNDPIEHQEHPKVLHHNTFYGHNDDRNIFSDEPWYNNKNEHEQLEYQISTGIRRMLEKAAMDGDGAKCRWLILEAVDKALRENGLPCILPKMSEGFGKPPKFIHKTRIGSHRLF